MINTKGLTGTADQNKVGWWHSRFSESIHSEVEKVISSCSFSQGYKVQELEQTLAERLGYEDCVCVTSGSIAIQLALMHHGIDRNGSILVPDRTWIATSHAGRMLGSDVVVAPINERLLIDEDAIALDIEDVDAVLPVFMNGRVSNVDRIRQANSMNKPMVYDCAQALGSTFKNGDQLSEQIDMGCYSLSMTKTISSGQGGFIGVNDRLVAKDLRSLRTHGLENVMHPGQWPNLGGNFRMTDLTAAVGLCQLRLLNEKLNGLTRLYSHYLRRLTPIKKCISLLHVDIVNGEVPQYIEVYSEYSQSLIPFLEAHGIETRPFFPPVSSAPYAMQGVAFREAESAWPYPPEKCFMLPSGPDRTDEEIDYVCDVLEDFCESEADKSVSG